MNSSILDVGTVGTSQPQAWPEPVDGATLLDQIEAILRRFVVLPNWAPETLALWVLHTYAFELRDVTAYLGIESPEKRCGKTTLLAVLSELVNRPAVAANISPPAFFRLIQETRPTLLIDEADTLLAGNDELRGILNSGYSRKTAFVVRVSSEIAKSPGSGRAQADDESSATAPNSPRASRLARYSCWCPKAMAAIGRLPDTLADRCIAIRMQRKTSRESCERLRTLDAADLRRQCGRFVLDHAAQIAQARPAIPEAMNDRAADIWEPLLALADLAGGNWPEKARQAASGLTAAAQETSPLGALLFEILVVFTVRACGRAFSRDIVARLNFANDRPWAELLRGREVTEVWLAQRLRPYGIRPRTIWIGEHHAKGYLEEDFMDVFRRYIPRGEMDALNQDLRAGMTKPQEPAS